MSRSFELIDVSHFVEDGLVTYKGLPAPIISDHLSRERSRLNYEEGTEFQIGKIEMVANTGTYVDSPYHRYPNGTDLAGLDLYSVANLDAIVVRCAGRTEQGIDETLIIDRDVRDKAVLFDTGWDKHWRTEAYSSGQHPFLTEGAAGFLAEAGAAMIGIDSYNIDSTETGARPAHSILLAHNIPIVEHLCRLGTLPVSGFKFFAVPVKIRNFGSFPVRAFALVT